jgi:hypothetical protein
MRGPVQVSPPGGNTAGGGPSAPPPAHGPQSAFGIPPLTPAILAAAGVSSSTAKLAWRYVMMVERFPVLRERAYPAVKVFALRQAPATLGSAYHKKESL